MGFFSRVFGPRKDIDEAADVLCTMLTAAREQWFNHLISVLQKREEFSEEVVNTELGGEAELAVKAIQLDTSGKMIISHGYIPESMIGEFADVLTKKVCESNLEACRTYFQRYVELVKGEIVHEFGMDVAKYISNKGWPEGEQLKTMVLEGVQNGDLKKYVNPKFWAYVATWYPPLMDSTRIAIAHVFGDEETAKTISESYSDK